MSKRKKTVKKACSSSGRRIGSYSKIIPHLILSDRELRAVKLALTLAVGHPEFEHYRNIYIDDLMGVLDRLSIVPLPKKG